MTAKEFHINDLVWAKMKGFPHWPARITAPRAKENAKKGQHFVLYLGSENYSWIKDEMIEPHSQQMLDQAKRSNYRRQDYLNGVEKIKELAKSFKKSEPTKELTASQEESKANRSAKSKPAKKNESARSKPSTPLKDKKSQVKKTITVKIQSGKKGVKRSQESGAPKSPIKKRKSTEEDIKKDSDLEDEIDDVSRSSPAELQKSEDDFAMLFQSIPPNSAAVRQQVAVIQPLSKDSFSLLGRQGPSREKTPELDVDKGSIVVTSRNVQPTTKKIGFIGLGLIASGIVKNLIKTGHNVTVWNGDSDTCEKLVELGAKQVMSPSQVALECDIIFSCLSDPEKCKDNVFGTYGILEGLQSSPSGEYKGYVEMTTIDPTISEEIAESVTERGGQYLEASIIGDRQQAEDGNLLFISAGDGELFKLCETCFHAIAKKAYYLSCDVGMGFKMNLAVSMLLGTSYASLAEAMALVKCCKLSNSNFLDLFQLSPLCCPLFKTKAEAMISKRFVTSTAIKYMQKDMNLAIYLAHLKSQPLPCSVAANDLFKRAKLLAYSEHDVAAIVFAALN